MEQFVKLIIWLPVIIYGLIKYKIWEHLKRLIIPIESMFFGTLIGISVGVMVVISTFNIPGSDMSKRAMLSVATGMAIACALGAISMAMGYIFIKISEYGEANKE